MFASDVDPDAVGVAREGLYPNEIAAAVSADGSNALKYTERGKILVGCRRRGRLLAIEVWDIGIGIPDGELQSIFEEYRQVDNPARESSRGLGLGLAIVQRLGGLLERHRSSRQRRSARHG